MAQIEWISVLSGHMPKDKEPILITVKGTDGKRYVLDDSRFMSCSALEKEYGKQYASKNLNGIFEWAYEAGAGYWEYISEPVIAWAYLPEPYKGA